MTVFQPKLDILPAAQRHLWPELRELPASFVLYGGTALALRVGGRESEDFDLFTNDPVDALRLASSLSFLKGAELIQSAPSTATFLVDRGGRVKISFFGGLILGRVGVPQRCHDHGLSVASLLDLAAQKVRVVQVRAERKDYLDLATLMAHGVSLARALGAAQTLYPGFAPLVTLKALSYFGDGDLETLPDLIKNTLAKSAGSVRSIETVPLLGERLT